MLDRSRAIWCYGCFDGSISRDLVIDVTFTRGPLA